MTDNNKIYQRILSVARGFESRFALLLIRGSYFDVQREWQNRLAADLETEGIEVIHIRGDELPEVLSSVTSFIQERLPASGRFVASLSHFDYHMLPTFSDNFEGKDLLSENYRPTPAPPSFLQRLNLERDAIARAVQSPLILWASPPAIRQMAEFAPDFFDYRQFIIDLPRPERLKTFPNIPRASVIKDAKNEALPAETVHQYNKKLDELRTRNRGREESRMFVAILNYLASSESASENWDAGMAMLTEAMNEAIASGLLEEQGSLEEQFAFFHGSAKRWAKALAHQEKAIDLFRDLAESNEIVYLNPLGNALHRKAILLYESGKRMSARKAYEEALKLGRTLFKKEPGVRAPLLAEILNNFALLLAETEEFEAAAAYYEEAVEILRGLPNKRYRIFLALALNNLGNLMANMNRLESALPLHQEALHVRRLYFAHDPGYYRAALSQSLYNLSLLLGEIGNFQQAGNLFEEALATMSYLPDHGFEFLGCSDSQIQMHGFRIELGEIEIVLNQHPAVSDAIVNVREDATGRKRMIAYITPKNGKELNSGELRVYLNERLPAYMIPAYFVALESLSLNLNGKINTSFLPDVNELKERTREKAIVAPVNDIQKKMLEIWSDVLGVNEIGVHDNFFEIGGCSLSATRVIAKINSVFGKNISARSFFEFPTICDLAKCIEGPREK